MAYIDAHCHLLKKSEFEDASIVGVNQILCNTTIPNEWDDLLTLPKQSPNIIPCIGIHPWHIQNVSDGWEQKMEMLLQQHPNLHIGEIGLDKLKPNFSKQKQLFLTQLKLAQKYNRIASIHCVKAWGELMPLLRPFRENTKMVFHAFSGDKIVIGFLANGPCYFSVHSDKKIPLIPQEKLLIESDAPDGISSPVALPFLYQKLHISAEQIQNNFERLINGR